MTNTGGSSGATDSGDDRGMNETGGGPSSPDSATSSGGTGGASSLDGATSSGGVGGVTDASSEGDATDAGIDASTDAALPAACNVTTTTLLANAGYDVDQIVLDGSYLYFHDGSGISRVPLSGGSATPVATYHANGWPPEHAFVIDDVAITWWEVGTDGDSSTITKVNRIAKTGGPITTLATLPADGSLSYSSIALGPAGSVFLWPSAGGLNPVLLQVGSDGSVNSWGKLDYYYNNSNDVVFDGTDVFATGDNGVYIHISNAFFDGFTSVTNATAAQDIVLEGTTMYIGSSDTSGYMAVYSVPKTGGTATPLFNGTGAGIYLGNLAIDANYLYAVERMTPAIVRMGKDGSNPTEIVTGLQYEQIEHVAVDDNCIYWSLQGSTQGVNRTQSGVYAAPK